EHGGAARLQPNDWHAVGDDLSQLSNDLAQLALGQRQHAVVVERATATQRPFRNPDRVAGRFEHGYRVVRDGRLEVVGERVDPQQHGWAARVAPRWPSRQSGPVAPERPWREARDLADRG